MNARFERSADSRMKLIQYFYWGNQETMDCHFHVRGTTGKYDVSWHSDGKQPTLTCSCPDFVCRQDHCKHIYFCFCRVLHLRKEALDNLTEHELLFAMSIFVAKRQALLQPGSQCQTRKRLVADTECTICFETMTDHDSVWCANSCQNYLHKGCMRTWIQTSGPTCPLCRAPWDLTQFET